MHPEKIIRLLTKMIRHGRHNRITWFWLVAVAALILPWVISNLEDSRAPQSSDTAGSMQNCRVDRIYDGDTITVNCSGKEEKIRLYCIDTPEMGQKPWGQQSRDYLRRITPGHVDIRPIERDHYGRLVSEVLANGRSLNLALVEAGQAAVYNRYCNDDRYPPAERAARQSKLGVWAQPGLQQRPWKWRVNK